MKRIALLGSTGSIGQQTLDVVSQHPDKFKIVGLAAGGRGETLARQIEQFGPVKVSLATEQAVRDMQQSSSMAQPPEYLHGPAGLLELATDPDVDLVVVATSGQHGFAPTLAALEAGKEVALANKEVLIMAGELVTEAAHRKGTQLRPIDSEHSAIWQCLRGEEFPASVGEKTGRRLILTSNGCS